MGNMESDNCKSLRSMLYTMKYSCDSGNFFAGLDFMILPSALTTYVSGSTSIFGMALFNTMSFLPMLPGIHHRHHLFTQTQLMGDTSLV